MKKKLLLTLVAMFALTCNSAFAKATFDFDNDYATLFPTLIGTSSSSSSDGDINEALTCTVNDISVTVSAKTSGNNANRIWSSSPRLRMYSGTLTITAPTGKNISSIAFTAGKWESTNTADIGTLTTSSTNASWSGTANTVVITVKKNTQIKSIDVYLEGESTGGIGNTAETAYTIAKAHELIAAGEGLSTEVYVKGIVTSVSSFNSTYGSITYYLGDTQDDLNPLQIYGGLYYNGDKFNSMSDLEVGDEIVVKGLLKSYNGTDEMDKNNVVITHKRDGKDVTPSENTDISNKPETAYTVAKAIELIGAGKGLTSTVYVKGYIVGTPSVNTSYGNATYTISDTKDDATTTLTVFRGLYLEKANFTSEDQIKAGDEVVVCGNLTLYTNNGTSTYELNTGNYLYSLNGKTTSIGSVSVAEENANTPTYNLAGQRVNKSYKGVVIKNGKKFVQK